VTAAVQTVTGPVDGSALGRTLVHEHIFVTLPGEALEPGFARTRADVREIAVDRLSELRDVGFSTFVDPCPIELGRDPHLAAEISGRTGMKIVCTTGFYTEPLGMPVYWRAREPEEIAEFFVSELTEGIADSGGIRPGAIKAATSSATDAERRMLTAAAMAQQETGAAIITHTDNARFGDVQQELFASGGADLSRVLIGHQDQAEEVTQLLELASRGTFVGIDRIGFQVLASDEHRADLVTAMVRQGLSSQVCLSQDRGCWTSAKMPTWVAPEKREARQRLWERIRWETSGLPHTYLVSNFLPLLRARGVTETEIERMLVDNPRRLLVGGP
jgi:phosphotriesterase-related protein